MKACKVFILYYGNFETYWLANYIRLILLGAFLFQLTHNSFFFWVKLTFKLLYTIHSSYKNLKPKCRFCPEPILSCLGVVGYNIIPKTKLHQFVCQADKTSKRLNKDRVTM